MFVKDTLLLSWNKIKSSVDMAICNGSRIIKENFLFPSLSILSRFLLPLFLYNYSWRTICKFYLFDIRSFFFSQCLSLSLFVCFYSNMSSWIDREKNTHIDKRKKNISIYRLWLYEFLMAMAETNMFSKHNSGEPSDANASTSNNVDEQLNNSNNVSSNYDQGESSDSHTTSQIRSNPLPRPGQHLDGRNSRSHCFQYLHIRF